jgi:large subunit ribosomal protein L25
VGEDKSPAGKTPGVVIQHLVNEIEISALPKNMPEYLSVDLSKLDAGDSVHLSDIVLPEGATIVGLGDDDDDNIMLANAIHVTEEIEDDESEDEAAEGEEAEGDDDADAEDDGDADKD